jgi:ribosomal protein L29
LLVDQDDREKRIAELERQLAELERQLAVLTTDVSDGVAW